jgi:protein-disulfide isomerase
MNSDVKIIGGVILLTVLILGGIIAFGSKSAPPPSEALKVDKGEYIRDDSSRIGSKDAKVQLVEFGDYQCPSCGAAYPVIKQAMADYNGQVALVFREFPLTIHQNAEAGARAAEAAGIQGKYTEMHDKLFETQDRWNSSLDPQKVFAGYAKDLGLDVNKFNSDFNSSAVIDKIRQDKGDGNALGVHATPTLYINGKEVPSAGSSDLRAAIDAALAQ